MLEYMIKSKSNGMQVAYISKRLHNLSKPNTLYLNANRYYITGHLHKSALNVHFERVFANA